MFRVFYIIFILGLFPLSCEQTQKNVGLEADETPRSAVIHEDSETVDYDLLKRRFRLFYVGFGELDNEQFGIYNVEVGFKDFIHQKSPMLQYKVPPLADYVEILRCKGSTQITSGSYSLTLDQLAVHPDKEKIMQGSDFWNRAEDTGLSSNCVNVSLGEKGTPVDEFVDSFSPSGSFRYLLRSCVDKQRLVGYDNAISSNRNCSKQVAMSEEFRYVNQRKDKEVEAIKNYSIRLDNIDQILVKSRIHAELMIDEIDRCEERENKRAIDRRLKEAYITVAATFLDIAIELKTAQVAKPSLKGYLEHYVLSSPLKNRMDKIQMIGALGGFSFKQMFMNLASTAYDMPRSCAKAIGMHNDTQAILSDLFEAKYASAYWMDIADLESRGQAIPALELQAGGLGI